MKLLYKAEIEFRKIVIGEGQGDIVSGLHLLLTFSRHVMGGVAPVKTPPAARQPPLRDAEIDGDEVSLASSSPTSSLRAHKCAWARDARLLRLAALRHGRSRRARSSPLGYGASVYS
jgi:hypothetical protein